MSGTILHLALEREWVQAQREGVYRTSTLGVSIADEGYLHACEDDEQLAGVVARYYGDVTEPLVLLTIDEARLAERGLTVRRERPAPGADLFPHVYGGDLPVEVVAGATPFDGAPGAHALDARRAAVTAPSQTAREEATRRLAVLATPPGALGRLGDLGVWLAACQGEVPPRPLEAVRLVIFAGDHGVAAHGVSAFPSSITGAMVRTFLAGRAGVTALASAHDVTVRVLDLGVDDDFEDLDEATRAALTEHKVRRGSGAIHLEDALTPAQTRAALDAGATVAQAEIAAGAQLLLSGDMGIGNTTPAAALVAAGLGLSGEEVAGRGTGITDDALRHKAAVIDAALARAGSRADDPVESLTALGSADLAATTGYLLAGARAGVPVLLDGLMAVACALTAERIEPGAAAWFAAGHRSTEPAQSAALEHLGLEPVLDLGLRLGEGSGAVAAVPVLRSAVALLRDVALLEDLGP